MRLSLDTNVLHQEGYMSQSMMLVKRLVAAGLIKLFISRMVLREYDSKRIADALSKLQSANDNLKSIKKTFAKGRGRIPDMGFLSADLEKFSSEVTIELEAATADWLAEFKVEVFDADPAVHEQVWDDYFSGKGAFRKPKNREDIPDAVIGRGLERLIADGGSLTFICKDGQLRSFMANFAVVTVFSELSDLVVSAGFVAMLEELDAKDKIIEEFKQVIGSPPFLHRTMDYFSSEDSDFYYAYWEEDQIEGEGNLPIPAWHITAGLPDVLSIENVQYGQVACINPKHYVVPVTFSAEVSIGFVGSYLDWHHSGDEVKRSIEPESTSGEGLCEFGLTRRAILNGEIVIHLLRDDTPQSLLAHSDYIGTDNSLLDVEFVPTKLYL